MGWRYVFITQISELVGIVGCAVEFKRKLQFSFDGAELGAFIRCVHWKNGSSVDYKLLAKHKILSLRNHSSKVAHLSLNLKSQLAA